MRWRATLLSMACCLTPSTGSCTTMWVRARLAGCAESDMPLVGSLGDHLAALSRAASGQACSDVRPCIALYCFLCHLVPGHSIGRLMQG